MYIRVIYDKGIRAGLLPPALFPSGLESLKRETDDPAPVAKEIVTSIQFTSVTNVMSRGPEGSSIKRSSAGE